MINKLKCGALAAVVAVSMASPAWSLPSPTPSAAQQDQVVGSGGGPDAFPPHLGTYFQPRWPGGHGPWLMRRLHRPDQDGWSRRVG